MSSLIIDNVNIENLGIALEEMPKFSSPEREIQIIAIPGREKGNVTKKLGWKDLAIKAKLAIYSFDNLRQKSRKFSGLLVNARELRLSEDPNVYYKVKFVQLAEHEVSMGSVLRYDVVFTCEPFGYQNEYESIYDFTILKPDDGFSVYNPSGTLSFPKITIEVESDTGRQAELWIQVAHVDDGSGPSMHCVNVQSQVVIDSDPMTVKFDDPNGKKVDHKISGEFPVIHPGHNQVRVPVHDGKLKKVTVLHRWRWLP